MADGCRNIVDFRSVCQRDASGSVKRSAENRFADLMHAGFGKTAETENFSPVKIKGHILDLTGNGNILHGKRNLSGNLLAVIGTIVITGYLTAYHQFFQAVFVHFFAVHAADVHTVPEDRDPVRLVKDFRKVMRDENDGSSVVTDSVHDLIQLLTAFLGKRRCGLVNYQNLRVKVGGFYNLDELSVLEVVIVDHVPRLDPAEAVLLQKFIGLFVHSACILDAVLDEHIFMTEEDIFGNSQTIQCTQLLYDNRNPVIIGIHLIMRVDFLTIQDELSAVLGINTGQHIRQRGFSGAVFADQGVHLTFIEFFGYVLYRLRDTEGFAHIHRFQS